MEIDVLCDKFPPGEEGKVFFLQNGGWSSGSHKFWQVTMCKSKDNFFTGKKHIEYFSGVELLMIF